MQDSAKKLIEQANVVSDSLVALQQYESGHLNVYMNSFRHFTSVHMTLANAYKDALNEGSLHTSTQQYLENVIKTYHSEISILNSVLTHEVLTANDFDSIKNCQENLKKVARQLDDIIAKPADVPLLNDAKEFAEQVKAVSPWVDMFFEEREKIKTKRADYISKSIEYQQLKQQIEDGSKKKSSSSATSSTTLPYIAPQWHNTPKQPSKPPLETETENLMSIMRVAFEQSVKSIKIPR
jgi:hypothetical protein